MNCFLAPLVLCSFQRCYGYCVSNATMMCHCQCAYRLGKKLTLVQLWSECMVAERKWCRTVWNCGCCQWCNIQFTCVPTGNRCMHVCLCVCVWKCATDVKLTQEQKTVSLIFVLRKQTLFMSMLGCTKHRNAMNKKYFKCGVCVCVFQ